MVTPPERASAQVRPITVAGIKVNVQANLVQLDRSFDFPVMSGSSRTLAG